jgi:hypothetical protein
MWTRISSQNVNYRDELLIICGLSVKAIFRAALLWFSAVVVSCAVMEFAAWVSFKRELARFTICRNQLINLSGARFVADGNLDSTSANSSEQELINED